MAGMDTDTLRERIAQQLPDDLSDRAWLAVTKQRGPHGHGVVAEMRPILLDAILPVVEQAIRQERERCGACAEHQHVCVKHHERVLEELAAANAALAEKDALQAKIDDAEGPWWATELASEGYDAKQEVKRLQAALEQFSEWLTVRDNMWMERAHNNRHGEGDVRDEHHVELVGRARGVR